VEILIYKKNNKEPFTEWLKSIKDKETAARIRNRVARIALGNLGDYKTIEKNLYEMRLFFGSGYGIYFGKKGARLVVLLIGGDKSTQKNDIQKAQEYWYDFKGESDE